MIGRWIFFIIYLAVVWSIGYFMMKRSKNLSDFYVAGKNLSALPLAGTFASSFVSAASILGYTAFAYSHGWALITIYGIGCAGGWMLLGFMSAKLRQFEAGVTSPDIYAERYSSQSLRVWIAFVFIVWQGLFLIQQFMGIGYTIETFLGIPYQWGVLVIGLTLVMYVSSGGMLSVVWTDVLQAIVMIIGVFIATIATIAVFGSFGAILDAARSIEIGQVGVGGLLTADAGGNFSAVWILVTLFSLTTVIACVPFYHRMFFSARTPKMAKATVGLATPVLILFYLCLAVLGLATRAALPELEVADRAFPMLADNILSPVLGSIVLACIVAAIMSSVDAILLATGTMFSHDIYARFINKKAPPAKEMIVTRIALVVVGVGGMLLSFNPPATIMDMYNIMIGVVSSTLFAPLFIGLFWRRATLQGAFAGSVGGFLSAWGWIAWGTAAYPPALIGIPVSAALLVIISLVTPRPPESAIKQFFANGCK